MTLISVLGLGWAAHAQSLFTEDFENENPVNANDLCVSGGEYTPADANWALGPACSVPTNGTPKLVERFGTTYLEYNRKYPADSEVFNSKAIDVTDIDNVRIQFNVLSEGGLESTGNGKDKFRMYAVLDGAEYLIYSKNGHVGSVTDPAGQGVNNSYAMDSHNDSFDVSGGSSLMLRLEVKITDGGNNKTGFSSERYDEIILREAPATLDREARYELYREAETILMESMAILPIYTYSTKHLTHPSVKGKPSNIMDHVNFNHIWLDPTVTTE